MCGRRHRQRRPLSAEPLDGPTPCGRIGEAAPGRRSHLAVSDVSLLGCHGRNSLCCRRLVLEDGVPPPSEIAPRRRNSRRRDLRHQRICQQRVVRSIPRGLPRGRAIAAGPGRRRSSRAFLCSGSACLCLGRVLAVSDVPRNVRPSTVELRPSKRPLERAGMNRRDEGNRRRADRSAPGR